MALQNFKGNPVSGGVKYMMVVKKIAIFDPKMPPILETIRDAPTAFVATSIRAGNANDQFIY